jgi:glycosyltransferase involved in cell wall biosynthesis
MRERLLGLGYRAEELVFVSNGFDDEAAALASSGCRNFDVAWAGRPHIQKGIEDLLETLSVLSKKIPDFSAVMIGKLDDLVPQLEARNLTKHIYMAGFVTEVEKFGLLKSSSVFLMPSRYESWGIVISEALASGCRVVAYDLVPYRAIFEDLIEYVPCFDVAEFTKRAVETVERSRVNKSSLPPSEEFWAEKSWSAAGLRFSSAMRDLVHS